MPKVSIYENSQTVDYDNRNSDPRTWGWNYPTPIKNIDSEYVLGADLKANNDGFITYGIFKKSNSKFLDEKDVVSAFEIQEVPGAFFDIPEVKKVAIEHTVATIPEVRGKGFARLLYDWIVEKYKVLFSDTELFTHKDKESQTYGIWKNYLPKLGSMLNWNTKSRTYEEFDPVTGKNEDVRFVVVSDKNIFQNMKESFSKWMKHGITSAALTGLLAMPQIGADLSTGNKKVEKQPIEMKVPYPPGSPELEPVKQSDIKPIEKPNNKINVNIIAQLESGGNAKVGTNRKGASGLCQLKKPAWDEAAKSLFGKHGHITYSFANYAKNASVNKQISDHYYNVVLHKHLEAFDIPIKKDTLLAAYNWGSNNVKKSIRRHGDNWLWYAPKETQSYIERYHNIEKNS